MNIQILHSHNYKENLVALLLSRICKVPHLVRTEHGHPEPYSAVHNLKHWCVLAANRIAAKYTAARIVSVSSDLGEFWKRRVDPQRVTILRNGVDLECVRSSFRPSGSKAAAWDPGDSFVVGVAARLECIKRHDLFPGDSKLSSSENSKLELRYCRRRTSKRVFAAVDSRIRFTGSRGSAWGTQRRL